MKERLTPTQILRILREGPSSKTTLTKQQVRSAVKTWPERYDRALVRLNFFMLESQYKGYGKNILRQYERFVRPWRDAVDREASEYFIATVDAYSRAIEMGFHHLDWENPKQARDIASRMKREMPGKDSIAGIPWRLVTAQIESTFSRDAAAETFLEVRNHERSTLVPFFYWDTGALTYYSENEIQDRKIALPQLSDMQSWQHGNGAGSDQAIVIAMDPKFFRIYGPMILFNAQQIPDLDFVLLLCGTSDEAESLLQDATDYLSGLATLNKQQSPSNLSLRAVQAPDWIGNDVTFYACARFLALPELLNEYKNIYAMDADLFIIRDPLKYLRSHASTSVGFPKSDRLLGVPPWRRFMAGNFVAGPGAADSKLLGRHLDYLSVGLTEPKSWMLDQNALSYAFEGASSGEFTALSRARPNLSGTIMANWEHNFKATLPS